MSTQLQRLFAKIRILYNSIMAGRPEDPTDADWKRLQGGRPRVETTKTRAGFTRKVVIHDYPGGSRAIVPIDQEKDYGKVRRQRPDGSIVEYPAEEVWAAHGKPCEERSLKMGGQRYPRLGQKKKR